MLKKLLLETVLRLLLLAELVVDLTLKGVHLRTVLFFNRLDLSVVRACSYQLLLLLIDLAHLRLDVVNATRPSVLEKVTQVSLDLVDVLAHSVQHLLFLVEGLSLGGLSN